MVILAIETSCDETAVSVVEGEGGFAAPKFEVLAHCVASQVKLHAEWGGVVPNLAKREHAKNIIPLVQEALGQAGLLEKRRKPEILAPELQHKLERILERESGLFEHLLNFSSHYNTPKIASICVTRGPGLEPALWVGINTARALALVWGLPIVPIDHMEGHFLSPMSQNVKIEFPALGLLISGGHTELVLSREWLKYEKLGQTRDDAVGEAFDKVARILGLPYPGGPEIGKLAATAPRHDWPFASANPKEQAGLLPRPMIHSDNLDFSFSGLKTAVLYLVQKNPDISKAQVAREFQQAIIDVLLVKTMKAIEQYQPKSLIIGGGVANNQELIRQFKIKVAQDFPAVKLLTPEPRLTTDNATMIAIAGYFHALRKDFATDIVADGNLTL